LINDHDGERDGREKPRVLGSDRAGSVTGRGEAVMRSANPFDLPTQREKETAGE